MPVLPPPWYRPPGYLPPPDDEHTCDWCDTESSILVAVSSEPIIGRVSLPRGWYCYPCVDGLEVVADVAPA